MTHPVRVPRDARTIPAYADMDAWNRLLPRNVDPGDLAPAYALLYDRDQVWPWLLDNGFRYHVLEDDPIHVARDGRTAYVERTFMRVASPWNRPQRGRDRYALEPSGFEFRTRLVGYPITRPLHLYAPTLAARIGLHSGAAT